MLEEGSGFLRVSLTQKVEEVGLSVEHCCLTRMVVLPAFLRERLAAHLATEVDDDARALVFTSLSGTPIRHGWFYKRVWQPALEEAGLPGDVRIHDLRHTSASLLISEGVHPRAVQAHLGHSSMSVTMDRYGHLFPSEFEAIAEKLEALHDRAAAQADACCFYTKGNGTIVRGLQNPLPGFDSRRRLHRRGPKAWESRLHQSKGGDSANEAPAIPPGEVPDFEGLVETLRGPRRFRSSRGPNADQTRS